MLPHLRECLISVLSLTACSEPDLGANEPERPPARADRGERETMEVELSTCEIVVDGSNDLVRALVNTRSGMLLGTRVVNGHQIQFLCPSVADRHDADIVAERTDHRLVHWTAVDLTPTSPEHPPTRVRGEDARSGLPTDLEAERLRMKWGDLPQPEAELHERGGTETESPKTERSESTRHKSRQPKPAPPKPARKVEVTFSAHRLFWAILALHRVSTNEVERLQLNPSKSRSLVPDRYTLEAQLEADGPWQSAGEFELSPSHESCKVQMLADPPRPKLTCTSGAN